MNDVEPTVSRVTVSLIWNSDSLASHKAQSGSKLLHLIYIDSRRLWHGLVGYRIYRCHSVDVSIPFYSTSHASFLPYLVFSKLNVQIVFIFKLNWYLSKTTFQMFIRTVRDNRASNIRLYKNRLVFVNQYSNSKVFKQYTWTQVGRCHVDLISVHVHLTGDKAAPLQNAGILSHGTREKEIQSITQFSVIECGWTTIDLNLTWDPMWRTCNVLYSALL